MLMLLNLKRGARPYFLEIAKIEVIGGRVMGGWYHQNPDYKAGVVNPLNAGIAMRNCLLSIPTRKNLSMTAIVLKFSKHQLKREL
ncbi:hypothetical protein NGUA41_00416 [Salmonella enterica]|nr:hypothetical protein CIWKM_13_03360 [Citrobacter werkmanii NBRC 105721]GAS72348.1 hypothetical protein NGUA40_01956 [Salmonella enterica]GAS75577.1 hypothetical protein NGUA41_00416 [Salmonella enterica]